LLRRRGWRSGNGCSDRFHIAASGNDRRHFLIPHPLGRALDIGGINSRRRQHDALDHLP
jgi:hypothetical protein